MISRKQLDEIENYLFDASLNDIPNVLGRVMPMLFSEMRVMMDLLDTRTEDFFNGRFHPRSGGIGKPDADRRQEFLGDTTSTPEPARPSGAEVSSAVRLAEEDQSAPAKRGGVPATQGTNPPGLDRGGCVVTEVGGPVRTGQAGDAGESSVSADRTEPVKPKRKRGRPRKNPPKEQANAGTEQD